MRGALALEDGLVFFGESFGAEGEKFGEVVFNTSMTGYQEILTDPSYKGQIVAMTYPLIGNYGVNEEDVESNSPKVEGFVVRELSKTVSNYRAKGSLADYLRKHNIIAIEGVDTRALTKHIRELGAMRAVISTVDLCEESLVEKARNSPQIVGRDLVKDVSCKSSYFFEKEGRYLVVVLDFGVKTNILRMLKHVGFRVLVLPAKTRSKEILNYDPDGIFLSNGPGDPEPVTYAIDTVSDIIGKKPIFGICLGHQILALSYGAKTYKLKFGHRGANQPVMDLSTKKVEITAQNHSFCVDPKTLPEYVSITHINLNDKTVEGIYSKRDMAFSVQYHPEASPGPHDSYYLFERFFNMVEEYAKKRRH